MSRLLVALALLCAFILFLLGFDVVSASNPHEFGWLGAALTLYFGSLLVP